MIKYMLTDRGVKDLDREFLIPRDEKNRHYIEYLEWVAEGNVPIPVQPDHDHVLKNDKWVLSQPLQSTRIAEEKKIELKTKMLELFEFTFKLFEILRDKEIVANTDFSADLRKKAAAWKTLMDEIDTVNAR